MFNRAWPRILKTEHDFYQKTFSLIDSLSSEKKSSEVRRVRTNDGETGLFIFSDDMFTTYLRSAQLVRVNKATV